jgi:hypothetical protein
MSLPSQVVNVTDAQEPDAFPSLIALIQAKPAEAIQALCLLLTWICSLIMRWFAQNASVPAMLAASYSLRDAGLTRKIKKCGKPETRSNQINDIRRRNLRNNPRKPDLNPPKPGLNPPKPSKAQALLAQWTHHPPNGADPSPRRTTGCKTSAFFDSRLPHPR